MFKIGVCVTVKFFGSPPMVIVDQATLEGHWVCLWHNTVTGGFDQQTFPEAVLCPDGTITE